MEDTNKEILKELKEIKKLLGGKDYTEEELKAAIKESGKNPRPVNIIQKIIIAIKKGFRK